LSIPCLDIEGIEVEYRGQQLLQIDKLSVWPGETLVVMGPNGAGKSTMIRIMALLQRPTKGLVRYHGEPVDESNLNIRRRMSVVLQQPILRDASVYDNVATGLHFRGASSLEIKEKVSYWLERLGIGHLGQRRAKTLSGGEAQRVSLARALALEPEVLFLDEPCAALDAPSKTLFLEDLRSLLKSASITAIMATHDKGEATVLGDRVAVLLDGKLRQLGAPREVFNRPVDAEVASFLGIYNIFSGTVIDVQDGILSLEVEGQVIRIAADGEPGQQATVCIRAEDTHLSVCGVRDSSNLQSRLSNRLKGRVAGIAPTGNEIRVRVDCGFEVIAFISAEKFLELGIADGDEVEVQFSGEKAFLI